ncbi:MAG: Peroxisomal membrane protein pex16 [Peltula sp. TS41687]|nr:MAG: Peroxisomal membrane protein pex16 [Peltula sp. TS41687]
MAFDLTLPLRGVQLLFNFIVLGCTAKVVHDLDRISFNSPSQVNFLLFVSIWTFLALLYLTLTPRFMPSLAHGFILLAVDALTMLFWFAGFIALAVFLSDNGTYSTITAACVFAAFEWILWAITTVLLALKVFRGGASSTAKPAGAAPARAPQLEPRQSIVEAHSITTSYPRNLSNLPPKYQRIQYISNNPTSIAPTRPKAMIPSIERLKQAPSRLPRPLSHLPDLLNLYGDFISKNASSVSQIESTLRSLTYIIPVHTFVQLLTLYHDNLLSRALSRLNPPHTPHTLHHHPAHHPTATTTTTTTTPHNRYTRFWTRTSPTYQRLALTLQMIQYTELLCEMVSRRRSERTRWRVVVLLECVKATCRLLLLRLTNARPSLASPLPEREVGDPVALEERVRLAAKGETGVNGHVVVVGKEFGGVVDADGDGEEDREAEAEATKPWNMPRTGMMLPRLPANPADLSSPVVDTTATATGPSTAATATETTTTYLLSHALSPADLSPASTLLAPLSTLPSIAGEVLYILRPVLHALALQHYHHQLRHSQSQRSSSPSSSSSRRRSPPSKWFPFLLGLGLEYAAYQLSASASASASASSKRNSHSHSAHDQARSSTTTAAPAPAPASFGDSLLQRRQKALLWWVMRAPVYEDVTGEWVRGVTGWLKRKPLLGVGGLVAGVLEDYDWLWREWYFSTATL